MTEKLPSLSAEPWLLQKPLQQVLHTIAGAGGEARVAGGAVRNALMGEAVTEIDLATTLLPDQLMSIAQAAGYAVYPTGLAHGTVTLVNHNISFEITTLRHDLETDGRHARVNFTADWAADAHRRDFTMNALYCDAKGRVYDYTQGYADILQKRVRFVGDPQRRIAEDYLRILRFFRFHARYGQGLPDILGLAACVAERQGLSTLSAERIRQEMLKLLIAPQAVATLAVMKECGVLDEVLATQDDLGIIALLPPDAILRGVAIAQQPAHLKDLWRLSNAEGERIEKILSAPPLNPDLPEETQHKLLYQLGALTWRDVAELSAARAGASSQTPEWEKLISLPQRWPIPIFPIKGSDLLMLGASPGPALGAHLKELQALWSNSDFKLEAWQLKKIYRQAREEEEDHG